MEDIGVVLERHEQRINAIEKTLSELKDVQKEIRSMNEILLTLTNEIKHTNIHLEKHEQKIAELDNIPKQRFNQIITSLISAIVGGIITMIINNIIKG